MSSFRKVRPGKRSSGGRPATHGARAVIERQRDRMMDKRSTGFRIVTDHLLGFAADFGGLEQIGATTAAVLEGASYRKLASDLWWTWAVAEYGKTGEWPSPPKWLYTNDAQLVRDLTAARDLETARRANSAPAETLAQYIEKRGSNGKAHAGAVIVEATTIDAAPSAAPATDVPPAPQGATSKGQGRPSPTHQATGDDQAGEDER